MSRVRPTRDTLDYVYGDVSDPFAAVLQPMGPGKPTPTPDCAPGMVGATARSFDLDGPVVRAAIPTPEVARGSLQAMGTNAGPQYPCVRRQGGEPLSPTVVARVESLHRSFPCLPDKAIAHAEQLAATAATADQVAQVTVVVNGAFTRGIPHSTLPVQRLLHPLLGLDESGQGSCADGPAIRDIADRVRMVPRTARRLRADQLFTTVLVG